MSEPLATLRASAPRRMMGVGTLVALGGLLFYLVLTETPQEFAYIAFMLVIGGAALWYAYRMWHATEAELYLTEEALIDSNGTIICRMEDVQSIDRGMFAFKPSTGFLIRLKLKYPRGTQPGIWWRVGTRIGVGGVTSPAAGKLMADVMSAMVANRDGKLG